MAAIGSRELWVLRHAKSAWDTAAPSDRERPLGARGRRDARRLGAWMAEEGLVPDRVVASPARRARETWTLLLEGMEVEGRVPVVEDERIYDADLADLDAVIRETPDAVLRLLLVGHNPGLDEVLLDRVGGAAPRTRQGKLMTTCALARLRIEGGWGDPARGRARLLGFTRGRDLPAGD